MQMMPMISWYHGFAKTELLGAGVAGEAIEGSSYSYNGLGHTAGDRMPPALSFVYNVCGISDQVNRVLQGSSKDRGIRSAYQNAGAAKPDPPPVVESWCVVYHEQRLGYSRDKRSPEET